MELADRLLAAGELVDGAKQVKIQAMRTLADQTMNAPTRNYYFLAARELIRSYGTSVRKSLAKQKGRSHQRPTLFCLTTKVIGTITERQLPDSNARRLGDS